MKKVILMSLLFIFSITLGLTSCIPKQQAQEENTDSVYAELQVAKAVLGDFVVVPSVVEEGFSLAEDVIGTDYEWMYQNEGSAYEWFECEVIFKDYLNDPGGTGEIVQVRNIFQKVTDETKGYDVHSFYATTNKDGTVYQKMDGIYITGNPLNSEPINYTFKEAYDILKEADIPKPASKYCVLRKPVLASQTNAIYIFGNQKDGMTCVDAMTGEVSVVQCGPLG